MQQLPFTVMCQIMGENTCRFCETDHISTLSKRGVRALNGKIRGHGNPKKGLPRLRQRCLFSLSCNCLKRLQSTDRCEFHSEVPNFLALTRRQPRYPSQGNGLYGIACRSQVSQKAGSAVKCSPDCKTMNLHKFHQGLKSNLSFSILCSFICVFLLLDFLRAKHKTGTCRNFSLRLTEIFPTGRFFSFMCSVASTLLYQV